MKTMRQDCDILTTNSVVSREEEPPHTSHHGAREISIGKNKEYKKEKIF